MRSLRNMADAPTGYMICTAPRSGSTLLCTLLRATGVAGWPESFFHGPTLSQWAKRLDVFPVEDPDMGALFAAGRAKGCAGGQVFGMRQQWPSFGLLRQALEQQRPEPTDRARLEGALGSLRYIHLKREDKLDQAVSYIRAEQSGIWHRNADGSIYEALPQCREDGFDASVIAAQIAAFETHDAGWSDWFASQDIAPLHLSYTGLAADPNGTLREVLNWVGLDPAHADGITAPTRKLADSQTQDWIARYTQDRALDA